MPLQHLGSNKEPHIPLSQGLSSSVSPSRGTWGNWRGQCGKGDPTVSCVPPQPPADQHPVTVTASVGEDACLPCGTQPWGHLRGVTLTCAQQDGTHHPVPILSHRLGWHPPLEPGWHPPEEPNSWFRGRVAFCAMGPGDAGVSLLLRNISDPDFGNYSCYVAGDTDTVPQLLCSLVLQPAMAGKWGCAGGMGGGWVGDTTQFRIPPIPSPAPSLGPVPLPIWVVPGAPCSAPPGTFGGSPQPGA